MKRLLAAALCLALTVCLVSGCLLPAAALAWLMTEEPAVSADMAAKNEEHHFLTAADAAFLPAADSRFHRTGSHTPYAFEEIKGCAEDDSVYEAAITQAEALEKLVRRSAPWEDVLAAYHGVSDAVAACYTLYNITYLNLDVNLNSLLAAQNYGDAAVSLTAAVTAAEEAMALLAAHPDYAPLLAEVIGEERVSLLAGYEASSPREDELTTREAELMQEYQLLSGKPYSNAAYHKEAGRIFLELVEVRNGIARLHGYDNYVDYSYREYYGRDYTPADARALSKAVKAYAVPALVQVYEQAYTFYLPTDTQLTAEEQLALLAEGTARISPVLEAPYSLMAEQGFYRIGSDFDMTQMSYVTDLYAYGAPFLYSFAYGDTFDLTSLVHEFGHYADSYYNPPAQLLTDEQNTDVSEVYSNGLQMLFVPLYPDLLPADDAVILQVTELGMMLHSLVSGCMEDEFQQYAYTTPDLTVEMLDEAYARIGREYGYDVWGDPDISWTWLNHTFVNPMYYISYAVSAVPALQLYTVAAEDHAAACDMYLQLLSLGSRNCGYFDRMDACGFSHFTDEDFLTRLIQRVVADIMAADSRYGQGG